MLLVQQRYYLDGGTLPDFRARGRVKVHGTPWCAHQLQGISGLVESHWIYIGACELVSHHAPHGP